jgi:hypothetical protein
MIRHGFLLYKYFTFSVKTKSKKSKDEQIRNRIKDERTGVKWNEVERSQDNGGAQTCC